MILNLEYVDASWRAHNENAGDTGTNANDPQWSCTIDGSVGIFVLFEADSHVARPSSSDLLLFGFVGF